MIRHQERHLRWSWRLRTRLLWTMVVVLLVPLWAVAAQGSEGTEPSKQLTLWQAVERALTSHPSVGLARARHDAATATAGEAEAGLRPMVSLTASATQFEEPMVVTPIHAFDPGQTPQFDETILQASAQVSYTLFNGGERGARIRQARAQADAAGAGLRNQQQVTVGRTVSTYLRVLSDREILGAHDQRLEALHAEEQRARQRLEVGRAPEVEVRRVEAALAAARAQQVRLTASLETAERDLARLIGGQVDETRANRLVAVRLAGEDRRERHELAEQSIRSSPAAEQATRFLLAAEAALALAKANRLPNLGVAGRYIDFGSAQGDFSGEWSAGLQLTVPLYTGGATRARIARAEAQREAVAAELKLVIFRIGEQLDGALAAVEEGAARRQSLEQAVASFREVARTEKLRLEVGTGTQRDFLDAEADLLVARADLAEARHFEVVARVEVARVTGELDLSWLRLALEREP